MRKTLDLTPREWATLYLALEDSVDRAVDNLTNRRALELDLAGSFWDTVVDDVKSTAEKTIEPESIIRAAIVRKAAQAKAITGRTTQPSQNVAP